MARRLALSAPISLPHGFVLHPGETAEAAGLSIFNRAAFFRLHCPAPGDGVYFRLCEAAGGRSRGAVHFGRAADGSFRSPLRGSFGGLEFDRDLPTAVFDAALDAVEARLAADGARRLEVVLPPAAHDEGLVALNLNVLRRRGYAVVRDELNQAIPVGPPGLRAVLAPEKRKKLNKCARRGIAARRLPAAALAEAYRVIVENRRPRGYALSMTWDAVAAMQAAFPDDVTGYGAFLDGTMIASCIAIAVTPAVRYAFYYGDRPGHERENPTVAVLEALYADCAAAGVRLLDLGASSIDGRPNDDLIAFKASLGATLSAKLWLARDLPA